MKKIPLVKPRLPNLAEIEPYVHDMLASGRLTNFSKYSCKLEEKVAQILGVKHILSVANATTGLMLILNTLPKGTEVLVPSFTFLPTVQAILWNSLKPVFVDIDLDTFNLSTKSIRQHITRNTTAILALHAFGNPCPIAELQEIAQEHHLSLFFDAAHAFGSKWRDRHIGSFGDAEVFSLSVTKILPCGEGGLITTHRDDIHTAVEDRRNYGFTYGSEYDCRHMGLNGKMTEFSAIMGLHGLGRIDEQIRQRNDLAQKYRENLAGIPSIAFQKVMPEALSNFKDFTIYWESEELGIDKKAFMKKMEEYGIETASYFSPAVHQLTLFHDLCADSPGLENTEFIEKRIVSLPIYPDMPESDFHYVVDKVKKVLVG
ncbi:MAG: DegT/DnrJ/EryC1/StrS family aminotransferase [Chrysiogenia bacterium]